MLSPRWLPIRTTRRGTALIVLILLAVLTAIGRYHAQQAGLTVNWPAVHSGLLAARTRLWDADPLWPLLAALAIAWRTSRQGRQWWTRHAHRARGGVAIGVVLALLVLFNPPRPVLLAAGVVGVVGLLAAWVLVIPRRLAPPLSPTELADLPGKERLELTDSRLKLQNDLRTTALQAIAGLAVLAGALLAFQQLTEDRQQAAATRELTRQGQASERFTRAVDQLGNQRREVQLGGIYALEQIAQQAPDNRLPVVEVLVAYVRRRAPMASHHPDRREQVEELRLRVPDVQAALTVLGRRAVSPDDPPLDLRRLDLRSADLLGANLDAANLGAADLRGADLGAADLGAADLDGADLHDANLVAADLGSANLGGADLRSADLDGADLYDANLRGADLVGADLDGANLHDANLDEANLGGANLRAADLHDAALDVAALRSADLAGADLHGANLDGADLDGADLVGTDLRGTDLRGANLDGANLDGANLDGANLRGAVASAETIWPGRFDWRVAGVRLQP
jgi:uncharacterized protein YjbI with pentapeptide repeats